MDLHRSLLLRSRLAVPFFGTSTCVLMAKLALVGRLVDFPLVFFIHALRDCVLRAPLVSCYVQRAFSAGDPFNIDRPFVLRIEP